MCLLGWIVRVHPVCMLQYFLSQLLVELGQIPRPSSPHAGVQVNQSPSYSCQHVTTKSNFKLVNKVKHQGNQY